MHVICLYDIHECVYVCEQGAYRDDCENTLLCAIYILLCTLYRYTYIYISARELEPFPPKWMSIAFLLFAQTSVRGFVCVAREVGGD